MTKLIFWLLVGIDFVGIVIWLLLGLAAAGPSRTSPVAVTVLLFVLPMLLLGAAVAVFHRSTSPALQGLAFALAAAPLVVVVGGSVLTRARMAANTNTAGELTFFREGPQRDLAEAISRGDSARLARLLPTVDVNATGLDGVTPLMLAMRTLRRTPTQHGVLRVLLDAGAHPNTGAQFEWPLGVALQVARTTGPEPVRLLLAAGADPNLVTESGDPLFFAAMGQSVGTDLLADLIDRGAAINLVARSGMTALLHAAQTRNWPAALVLLERGADPDLGRTVNGAGFAEVIAQVEDDSPTLAQVRQRLQGH